MSNAKEGTVESGSELAPLSLAPQNTQLAVAETATAAAASHAEAMVKAAYVMALQRPRDWRNVRQALLHECKRPGFANLAVYSKPQGGTKITGLSVRTAEACVRIMGNIRLDTVTIYDDDNKRIVRQTATDLETNAFYSKDITLQKTVERKSSKGREVIGQRTNSYGQQVFIVKASEDELMTRENALVSKALRNNVLKLVPGDILDEMEKQIQQTLRAEVREDPDQQKKNMCDAFADFGVKPAELEKFLGKPLDRINEDDVVKMKAIYQGISSGEASWDEVVAGGVDPMGSAAAPARGGRPEPEKGKLDLDSMQAGDAADHQDHQESAKAISASQKAPKLQDQLRAVMDSYGVSSKERMSIMVQAFGDGDRGKADVVSRQSNSPAILEKWLSENYNAPKDEPPAKPAAKKPAAKKPAAKKPAPEPDPEPEEEETAGLFDDDETTEEEPQGEPLMFPEEPKLPKGLSWPVCIASAMKAARIEGKAIPVPKRLEILKEIGGPDAFEDYDKGTLNNAAITWEIYCKVRWHLAEIGAIGSESPVKDGKQRDLPPVPARS